MTKSRYEKPGSFGRGWVYARLVMLAGPFGGQALNGVRLSGMKRRILNLLVIIGLGAALLPPGLCLGSGQSCCCGPKAPAQGLVIVADCACNGPGMTCARPAEPMAPSPDRVTLPAAPAPAAPLPSAAGLAPAAPVAASLLAAASGTHALAGPPLSTLLCSLRI